MNAAFVNEGRWVAFCSTPGCDGAEQRFPDGPRFKEVTDMLTGRVSMVPYGIHDGVLRCATCGAAYPVVFPEDQGAIEEVLVRRPLPMTRNWFPGESVSDLIEENRSHGLD